MRFGTDVEVKWNLEIDVFERGKRRRWHSRTHNIVVNTGRQFMAETITPATLGAGGSFTRTDDSVIRYIGFGIGGNRQSSPNSTTSPYNDPPPGGYGNPVGSPQGDDDVTVSYLERPVRVSTGPEVWMKEVTTPGDFPTATETRFITTFQETDISYGAFTSVPLSEIGLYKSGVTGPNFCDPSLFNGTGGGYPGSAGFLVAYDTFDPIHKTGMFTIQVRWTWRF